MSQKKALKVWQKLATGRYSLSAINTRSEWNGDYVEKRYTFVTPINKPSNIIKTKGFHLTHPQRLLFLMAIWSVKYNTVPWWRHKTARLMFLIKLKSTSCIHLIQRQQGEVSHYVKAPVFISSLSTETAQSSNPHYLQETKNRWFKSAVC